MVKIAVPPCMRDICESEEIACGVEEIVQHAGIDQAEASNRRRRERFKYPGHSL
jgi:hypothetical protein